MIGGVNALRIRSGLKLAQKPLEEIATLVKRYENQQNRSSYNEQDVFAVYANASPQFDPHTSYFFRVALKLRY